MKVFIFIASVHSLRKAHPCMKAVVIDQCSREVAAEGTVLG